MSKYFENCVTSNNRLYKYSVKMSSMNNNKNKSNLMIE